MEFEKPNKKEIDDVAEIIKQKKSIAFTELMIETKLNEGELFAILVILENNNYSFRVGSEELSKQTVRLIE